MKLAVALFALLFASPACATYSIVACDPETGELGVAVASKVVAVGALVPYARAGAGAVATQALCNPNYGPAALDALAAGRSTTAVIELLTAPDADRAVRQVAVLDAAGRAAVHTGAECLAWCGSRTGAHYAVLGNILTGPEVLVAMESAFSKTRGPLAERLLAALAAGERAGGDSRGRQSAALLVVQKGQGYAGLTDRKHDLRVDDHARPVEELMRLYRLQLAR